MAVRSLQFKALVVLQQSRVCVSLVRPVTQNRVLWCTDDEDAPGSIGVGRYPCMPSLVALQQMRNRLHLAYLGKKLMKWTAMATGRELRRVAAELNK